MGIAFTFPGQGSQAVGMLAGLAGRHPEVGECFAEASEILGYDLWALCQEGPAERLAATEHTQPAMLCAGVATLRCWVARGGPAPELLAGHSLGEYSALVCAGALGLADAVRAVAARARFMQEAVPCGQGGIAALLGLDEERVVALCAEASAAEPGALVSAVNFNGPGQVVVAGHVAALERVLDLARQAGARRAVRLPMSVPVHCPLMAPAAERLAAVLETLELRHPRIPVIHNADLGSHRDPGAIRAALVAQLTEPVRWQATVAELRRRGATILIELGPGRVLTGLARRIDRELTARAVHDPASLDEALAALEEGGTR